MYEKIKNYVPKEFGLKVSNLYISQVKSKYGIGIALDTYWGFIPLTDDQFQNVLKGGNVNENIVVD